MTRSFFGEMILLVMLLACTNLAIAKNVSMVRFLQYKEHPKMPACPETHVDRTYGNAYHWECGKKCPVEHWTDACCYCACVRPGDGLANADLCGHVAVNSAPAPTPPQQPAVVEAFNNPAPSRSSRQAAPAPAPQSSSKSDDAGLPAGVILLLVLLGVGAAIILCVAVTLAMNAGPKVRITAEDLASVKPSASKAMPASVVAIPNSGQEEMKRTASNSTVSTRATAVSAASNASHVTVQVRTKQGTYSSRQSLRSTARPLSLSPRGGQDSPPQALDLVQNRARSLSPRPQHT